MLPDSPAIDCWHWLLCGWVVVPRVGTLAGPEWLARVRAPRSAADDARLVGLVTEGVSMRVYEGHPVLQFPPEYDAGEEAERDAD